MPSSERHLYDIPGLVGTIVSHIAALLIDVNVSASTMAIGGKVNTIVIVLAPDGNAFDLEDHVAQYCTGEHALRE